MRAPTPNFLSAEDCAALMRRVAGFTQGGGTTEVRLDSAWIGNVRWGRNRVSTGGEVKRNTISVSRRINGAGGGIRVNGVDDTTLENAVRFAEHVALLKREQLGDDLGDDYQEPIAHPNIWFDTTYHLDAEQRAAIVHAVIEPIERAGMTSAGYLEVRATGRSIQSSRPARTPVYYPWTSAQFSITVRDPQGTGSGWAGVDWSDWSRIDASKLAQIALDKCLTSRNLIRLEPGRYTAILEPQAVCDLMDPIFSLYKNGGSILLESAERGNSAFAGPRLPLTRIGQTVLDTRITITADPMDPELGIPPFNLQGWIFHPATWIERGVLKNLAYGRQYAMQKLFLNNGLPNSGAFHMTGGTTSIDEMIGTTRRGLLVTRFSGVTVLDTRSVLCTGYTRDGLWLVEDGKISKAVKNFRFTESPLFVFNQVEQLGVPQRVFHPVAPVVVPAAKVHDFSFTSLSESV
jgi:predicted Zn-dependent protease